MNIYTIKAEQFLEWYFNSGSDDEIEDAKITMGNRVIDSLIGIGQSNITIEDIFGEANLDTLRVSYLEEFSDDDDEELGDYCEKLGISYNVTLIN